MTKLPDQQIPASSSAPHVKVCGLTRYADAELALQLGARFLGFIFAENTPREVKLHDIQHLLAKLRESFAPDSFSPVGVFVSEPPELMQEIVSSCDLSAVQIHGKVTQEHYSTISVPIIPAIRVRDQSSIEEAAPFLEKGPVLLDTYVKGQHGGTGQTFQHDLAVPLLKKGKVFIAGGLGPETISPTLKTFETLGEMPYAFDLSSGLEEQTRIKSTEKMKAFFRTYSDFFHED